MKQKIDPTFILLEDNYVYHLKCVDSKEPNNVVPLIKKAKVIGMIGLLLFVGSCGKAHSDSTRAEVIPAPMSGFTCFIIKDGDGKAVGGNCVRD